MDYTPHTDEDIEAMLAVIGAGGIADLFAPIPESIRLGQPLSLPGGLSESEVVNVMTELADKNISVDDLTCFAGGGAYDHYVPAVVKHLAYRAEFATSYTPYQPELSQGVLGALFEFQSMVCELTGLDVANASLYDGAAALVEAVNLATGATRRKRVVVSGGLNPNYRKVLATIGAGPGWELATAPLLDGVTAIDDPASLDGAAALVVAHPNFLGSLEDLPAAAEAAHRAGAMLIVAFDPTAAGILEAPGALGADVVVGEGQALGTGLNFGGPYLGLFATRSDHVRRVPGRIVGTTVDVNGTGGFVLTLQAREQHIRRDKATSNVCTNQTLMAIAATVYLSWLGPAGLVELGECCLARARYAAELASSVPGCSLVSPAPFFKEFALRVPGQASAVIDAMAERGYLIGPSLEVLDPALSDCLLIAVTERRRVEEIESLCKALAEVVTGARA
ncbi:MAG TPA: aminomethyl-transferring glycine dehydrogenase subunit GcvPA [Actinomycetota bacterium]|nr:aminomethyl-transferring glycine dehydrogenase subunit GcvPA [Actinomycetota bacterium]